MIPTQPATIPASPLLRIITMIDLLFFGLLPIAIWMAAGFMSAWFFSQSALMLWLAPAEGFAGYLLIYCIPLEAARIALLITGVRTWAGSVWARTPFILLLIALSLTEPCAAVILSGYQETSSYAGPGMIVHLILSGVLVALTLILVWKRAQDELKDQPA